MTFATCFDCKRPAFWLERAVTKPAVRSAGLEPADHLVCATIDPALAWTTAMFLTETLGFTGSGAARHRARLPARSVGIMLGADTTCIRN